MEEQIGRAVEAILSRKVGVALTGAGVSAESGISTYRDPGGLWDTYQEGASGGMMAVLAARPDKAPEILGAFFGRLRQAQPNPGHLALAELEKMGHLSSVITQNVDGLHRRAGSTVYELHGSLYRVRCLTCGRKQELDRETLFALVDRMIESFAQGQARGGPRAGVFPPCACGAGPMRLDFVSFGEPVQELDKALSDVSRCDFMLVVGTSGFVHPAAALPGKAKAHGAFLIEVNPKESELTPLCDLFLQGAGGEVLPKLVEALRGT